MFFIQKQNNYFNTQCDGFKPTVSGLEIWKHTKETDTLSLTWQLGGTCRTSHGWPPWRTWEHQRWVQRWWLSWRHPSSEPAEWFEIIFNLFWPVASHVCFCFFFSIMIILSKVWDWAHTEAFSMVVNTPVDSTTYWAPASPHLMLAGSLLKAERKVGDTINSSSALPFASLCVWTFN